MAIQKQDIIKGTYGSIYHLVWDGWQAFLTIREDGSGYLSFPRDPRNTRAVRFELLKDPQDIVDGLPGPGYLGNPSDLKHRIVFWVDFDKSPGQPQDDQRFDGYFFTQTRDAMAGVTWWNGIPFGFYATYAGDVIG